MLVAPNVVRPFALTALASAVGHGNAAINEGALLRNGGWRCLPARIAEFGPDIQSVVIYSLVNESYEATITYSLQYLNIPTRKP